MEQGEIRLQRVKVEMLHDCYDYDISLSNEEHVAFITGPNGYGKTTILRIIYHLLSGKFYYFSDLLFEQIVVGFSGGYEVIIRKQKSGSLFAEDEESSGVKDVVFSLDKDTRSQSKLVFRWDAFENLLMERKLVDKSLSGGFISRRSREEYNSLFEFLESGSDLFSEFNNRDHYSAGNELILFLGNFNVYYLRDKRLLDSTGAGGKHLIYQSLSACSRDLSDKFREVQAAYMNFAQELENSFPNRVLNSEAEMLEVEYMALRSELASRLESLSRYDIIKMEIPEFSAKNAQLLTVFVQDVKAKVEYHEPLLKKLKLFDRIIQAKLFPGKRMVLSGGGIRFVSEAGKQILLESLSSGEQQELILMYNLIFGVAANTVVLIDEPETSLHVTWQRLFLNDLLATTQLSRADVIVATHSPQIINNRWDLSVDLYGITNKVTE